MAIMGLLRLVKVQYNMFKTMKKGPLAVLRARVPHQAALLPRPYLGRRRKNGRKIEI